ncbi:MAG: sulfatase-like hydrolase/transferase, partial [Bacteroidales bacterium]|nr:sulfatase-like hydrolase/transferase [Bacteroidales bacterium]
MRYPKSRCTLTIFSIMVMFVSCSVDDNQLPNILIILADDMGYSNIGCYGGEINTPNLDNLAKNGVQFTQFYNTARCCPTRGSLLTGIYPHECGIGHMTHANGGGAYTGYLLNTCVTIPELLADAGYATSISGKWHAGTVRESWPENRGFQRSYSIHNWVDSYFKVLGGCEVFEDGKIILPRTDNPGEIEPQPNNKEWYTTDVFASKTIQFIDEAEAQQKPFFHYLAFNAPHWPLEAHDSVIAKYLDKYEEGYEELRKSKYQKMIDMGLVNANWDYPEQLTPNWDELSDSVKQDTRFRRAIYAAQVEIMDENIGRIVNHLKEKGNLDNTLIFFLSDNGCASEPMKNWFGYTWGKNTKWNYPQWRKNSARAGASQGKVWAITSNTPFQKYKRYTFEGGISTP